MPSTGLPDVFPRGLPLSWLTAHSRGLVEVIAHTVCCGHSGDRQSHLAPNPTNPHPTQPSYTSNQAYNWMKGTMTHPNSLENLKLGATARRKGKVKLNLTVLPSIADKLKLLGNASRFVELLLQAHEKERLLNPREIIEEFNG